jgi:hypothetical protein
LGTFRIVQVVERRPTRGSNDGIDLTIDPFGNVGIGLVGGLSDGLVFSVPHRNILKCFGIGYPVLRYEPQPGKGDVRIYRYVSVKWIRQC